MKHKLWSTLLRPSTRAFIAEARRTPNYSWFDWLHGYVYARWPYLYIGLGVGEHPLSRTLAPLVNGLLKLLKIEITTERVHESASPSLGKSGNRLSFADTYHGKVVPLEAAKGLVMINQEISLTNLEQIIPYARARDIILHNPDHIVVLECPCRAARSNPCQPLDVCLIIGEPLAGFVAEHHPGRSRRITPDEAVEILQAEDERGHVHHAFFKDAMLGRFYAICNCCACCCGAMQAQRNGVPMLAASGYVSYVDQTRCVGCGTCVEFCQFHALSVNVYASVDANRCMGCGVCVSKCPQGAMSMQRDVNKGEPLEIHKLMAEASQTVVG
ncbi:MAG: 4Fe-4S binding protein [Anaerolineae bacterium]|nr:4Fe-4S binding protein [Anaerolineae bacterium]